MGKELAQMLFTVRCVHAVYGDKQHVWCKKFAHGRESVVDEERPGCLHGRRVVSTTDATIATVSSLMRSDRHVMG